MRRHSKVSVRQAGQSASMQKQKKISIGSVVGIVLLLGIGFTLIFNQWIQSKLITNMGQPYALAQTTAEDIQLNQQADATFDFEAVDSVGWGMVMDTRSNAANEYSLGGIAIPTVGLNLPILKGLSNYALLSGAGTMKPDQVMGKGNYALAGHHMIQPRLLFGPLASVAIGSEIYITDLLDVYTYRITMKEYVSPHDDRLIHDVEGEELITLVTCDTSGNLRLVVQGVLEKQTPIADITPEMTEAFELPVNA